MPSLGRLASEGTHDRLDFDRDHVDGRYRVSETLGLVNRYVRGDVSCHLHIDVRASGEPRPEQFCAEFRSVNHAQFAVALQPLDVGGRDHEDAQVNRSVNSLWT